ncbi:MAG: ABC transporter permease [Spirochaetales bacterium]|nr:ABC transporter permease [Spirochaetales bacterium]
MLFYIIRRFLYFLLLMVLLSIAAFIIIQLPPGDYVSVLVSEMEEMQGVLLDESEIESLRIAYGLDKPMYIQYFRWISRFVKGDFGMSIQWQQPVSKLIMERVPLTIVVSLITMFFAYAVGVPIGVYSATHQYSIGDYTATTFGFIGIATPNFLLAIILMFLGYKYFGWEAGGLFSTEYLDQGWSFAKFIDLLKHLPIPVIVIGTAGTAGLVRIMRGCLLDELKKQYVVTARSKGLTETRLLFKYPMRIAVNPIVSTIGWSLAGIVSGATITSIVLNLPTTGPLLYQALLKQDMELAGSIILILSSLTLIGTFISDILLVVIDPRIRFEKKA